MGLLSLVMLAAAKLHDPHLVALAVGLNGRSHLAAFDEGLAQLYVGALTDEQHLAEFDRCPRSLGKFFDPQDAAFLDAVLLAASRDHRKHLSSPRVARRVRAGQKRLRIL